VITRRKYQSEEHSNMKEKEKEKREKWVGAKKDECTNGTSAWELVRVLDSEMKENVKRAVLSDKSNVVCFGATKTTYLIARGRCSSAWAAREDSLSPPIR
jgi:hypothetical protein